METIKVKIPLAIDAKGNYCVYARDDEPYMVCVEEVFGGVRDDIHRTVYCVVVEVPVPEVVEVQWEIIDRN